MKHEEIISYILTPLCFAALLIITGKILSNQQISPTKQEVEILYDFVENLDSCTTVNSVLQSRDRMYEQLQFIDE